MTVGAKVEPAAGGGFGEVQKVFRRLGPAGPLAVIAASMPIIAGFAVLGSLPWVGGWLKVHPGLGGLLYVSCYAVFGGLGFLPTYAYSALGGYSFGFGKGLALALASYTAASVIAYVVARRASGGRVLEMIGEHPRWQAVYEALLGSGLGKTLLIVTLLRLPPNSPFALTNLVMASTRVHPVAFLVGTVAGITPRTGVVVFMAALYGLEHKQPFWLYAVGIVVTLVVLGVIGHLANQAIARVTGQSGGAARGVSQ